ncbi:MAG: DUF1015 domain-containing protein [bacterium]
MAKIASFRGYRFNRSIVGDLNQVVTQPYDKIDDELRDEYLKRSPYNIVRITKNPPTPTDTPNDNPYTRASTFLNRWIEDGVLLREPGPSIYPYYQEFTVDGKQYIRKGLVVLVSLEEKIKVRAHEETLTGPKADRLKLMRALEANEDFVFMLYDDPQHIINQWLGNELSNSQPVMEVKDDYGAIHRLYRLSRPSLITDINEFLEDKELYIADGHHRFETSLNFMRECRGRNWKPVPPESFNFRMMCLFNVYDPGLVILPTHRVLHSLPNFQPMRLLEDLKSEFSVEVYSQPEGLYEALNQAAQEGSISMGFIVRGSSSFYLITLKDSGLMERIVPDKPSCWRNLDVTVLHSAILERFLGVDAQKLASESHIHYVREKEKALSLVQQDPYQCAFLLNPTRVTQVQEVAATGEKMPQKSTDFYPKLLTGLVLMKMNIDKSAGLAVWQAEE